MDMKFLDVLLPMMFEGLKLTVLIAVVGIGIGFLIGSLCGYLLQSKYKVGKAIAEVYIWIIRATPLMVQALYGYFVIPKLVGVDISSTIVGIGVIALNSGAFISEIVKGALMGIDPGQKEAGASLGLTSSQTMIHLIIPPAFKSALPALFNQFITSVKDTALLSAIDHHSIRNWISIYQYDGPTGLLNQPKNKSYSKDLKISAINDYLNGEGSLQDICTKYGIRSHRQLSDWIKVYNSGGILKTSTGGAYMKKAKNTTLDERLKIVTDCLANDKNYGAMALKYDCSYQQVRNWVIRYEKMGQAGLEDRRGRRIASLPSRTPEEELRDKIAELERRNLDLQMENDLLKKVRELERRGRYL